MASPFYGVNAQPLGSLSVVARKPSKIFEATAEKNRLPGVVMIKGIVTLANPSSGSPKQIQETQKRKERLPLNKTKVVFL
jgi:hypothetical protein